MTKLLACQKCSSPYPMLRTSSDGEAEWVRCKSCAHEGPVRMSTADAIAAWNEPPKSPPQPAVSVTPEDRRNAFDLMLRIGRVSPIYEKAIMAGEWDDGSDEIQAFARHRASAAPPADGVPAGFVLAPIEPTQDMIEAANGIDIIVLPTNVSTMSTGTSSEEAQDIWSAMLKAAPKAPAAPIGEAGEGVLPSDAGICAYDRQECTVTLALNNEAEVMTLVRNLPGKNRVALFDEDAALSPSAGARYRHIKRGTVYEVVGEASLQIATSDVVDGSDLVIYRSEDGKLWAREHGEFHDGRFAALGEQGSK